MTSLALVLLVPGALLWGNPTPAPGIQAHVRSSIGEDRIKGDPPPGMIAIETSKATIGLTKDEMKELLQTYTAEVERQVIAGSSPDHIVQVEKFLLDQYEVPNQQYRTWLEANKLKPSAKLVEFNWPKGKSGQGEIPAGQENNPICGVSFLEAQACARWMGKRLPSEEEWELAARGNDANAKNNRFVWGKTWDHSKCANGRSARGNTAPVGTYKEDVSPFQIYDMMGNVAEWTTSPYTSYPGFKPVDIVDPVSKKQITIRPSFQALWHVVRGGSAEGTELSCNSFLRQGFSASDRWSRIGFRCAKSVIPGRDALDDALDDLGLISEVAKNPMSLKDLCAQEILYQDPAANYAITGSRHLSLGHVEAYRSAPWSKLLTSAVEEPVIVAVLTTSEKIDYPKLEAGSYAILYKPAGTPKKKATAATAKEDEKPKPKDEAKPKDEPKPKDEAKPKDSKDKDKDKAKPPEATPPGAKAKDAPKPGTAAKDAPKASESEKNGDNGEPDPALALIGGKSTMEDVVYPMDKNLYLFKATNGKIVGFMEADPPTEGKRVKANFTYGRASAGDVPKAMMVTGGGAETTTVKASQELDVASFDFYVYGQNPQANAPRFKMRVFFKANTFEPEDGQ
jgi:formylglycine-generating enzyme required for sulfatase activity